MAHLSEANCRESASISVGWELSAFTGVRSAMTMIRATIDETLFVFRGRSSPRNPINDARGLITGVAQVGS